MVGWLDGWMVGWLDGKEIFEYTQDRSGPKTRATRGQASLRSELIKSPGNQSLKVLRDPNVDDTV